MEDQDDFEFESLLDAALGIEQSATETAAPASKPSAAEPTHYVGSKQVIMQPSGISYDQLSPSPSPGSSPMHPGQYPAPCSPCWSSSSMQMHASFQDSSTAEQHYDDHAGMYSPIRDPGSPLINDVYPLHQRDLQKTAHQNQHQQHHQVDITALPREVQMRMLCFLSADALTTLAQTCKHFSMMCSEPVLWRRLFCFRWGKKGRQQNQLSWKARYMERDLIELRAATGCGAGAAWAGAGDPAADAMQQMFIQAHIARRSQALPRAAIDDLMLVEDDEVAARVVAWRKARGFDTGGQQTQPQRPADIGQNPEQAPGRHRTAGLVGTEYGASGPRVVHRAVQRRLHHKQQGSSNCTEEAAMPSSTAGTHMSAAAATGSSSQAQHARGSSSHHSTADSAQLAASSTSDASRRSGSAGSGGGVGLKRPRQRRRWTQIGNVFCDEMTGWVHVCDETCSEKIIEPTSGLLVCPISGLVADRMMTCAEEAAEEGERDEQDRAMQDEDWGGERGRLGRAFVAGYYCTNEKELMKKCGVRLAR